MAVHTVIYEDATLPDAMRPLITAWDAECFTVPNEFEWSKPRWNVFVFADETPVSYVGIFKRLCLLDGQPIPIAGIGSVMTPAAHRFKGFATTGLRQAQDFMQRELNAPFAQLVTKPYLIPYYERLGWQVTSGPLLVQLPDGKTIAYREPCMILSLQGQPWPGGTLDLCGKPW